jgi:F0F1-type ATP synthase membrane subunit b/b'
MMPAKHKVTVSTQPTNRRLTSAERHALQIASLSTKQAELKREAAERRAKRESENLAAGSAPRNPAAPRGTSR